MHTFVVVVYFQVLFSKKTFNFLSLKVWINLFVELENYEGNIKKRNRLIMKIGTSFPFRSEGPEKLYSDFSEHWQSEYLSRGSRDAKM